MTSFKDSDNKLFMGMIFHVGLYSFFAYDDIKSVERRKILNGSEWYLHRLLYDRFDRDDKINKTQLHHASYGTNVDYFKAPFHISRESVCQWLDLCVRCKVRYVIITSKHHDGYCLWPTRTDNQKSKNDVIQIFKEECLNRGLLFGIYYSWYEFANSMTIDYFERVCIPQVTELLQYEPTFLWFDGDWVIKQKRIIEYIRQMMTIIKSKGIFINDRITGSLISEFASYSVGGDYTKTEDRGFPTSYRPNWQHINTIGLSWGYNKIQTSENYKTGNQLMDLYKKTVNLGGSFLLNIGPKHDGTLDENEVNSLEQFISLIPNIPTIPLTPNIDN